MADFFAGVPSITYEGPDCNEPLALRQYDPSAVVEGRSMRDHLRFASCYWHTMRNRLSDPFGAPTAQMPWDDGTDSLDNALRRVDAFGEFLSKTGIGFWCFHDRDVAPERDSLVATERDLHAVIERLESMQRSTGARLLWGTACLFSHPRYMHGAATSPDVRVFLHAAAQVRVAMEATMRLGGEGYVFWGGREGYTTLLNTDLRREREQLATFLHLAVDHARSIGFTGQLYIEPKPHEPSTHQYDSDVEATLNFLREFGLIDHVKLNIETNHATLAGHSMEHELRAAIAADALGSIDANMGTPGLGWDTDRFPTDLALTTQVMLAVLDMGGFTTGGLNFDAKRRRESFTPEDLVIAHLAGMDAFAAGLKVAAAIRKDGRLAAFVRDRYSSWQGDLGRRILSRGSNLAELHRLAHDLGSVEPVSGRQEMLEDIVNQITIRALR